MAETCEDFIMSDLLTEQFLSIDQIAKLLPPNRQGKPVNFSTIYRWIFTGVRSIAGDRVRLEATRMGGRWLISREALQRFSATLGSIPAPQAMPQTSAGTKASERAKKKLAALGI